MITLANIATATKQQIFDQVSAHVLKQNRRSADGNNNCVYRGPDGLKCAAGCLIADSEFKPGMDQGAYIGNRHYGSGWGDLIDRDLVPNVHREFILEMQGIHDTIPPEQWKEELNALARRHSLTEIDSVESVK